jgi:hypothetical protein
MRDVIQTWDSVYWLAPKIKGVYIKIKNKEYGLGKNPKKLHKIFGFSKYEHGENLFKRLKYFSIIFFSIIIKKLIKIVNDDPNVKLYPIYSID